MLTRIWHSQSWPMESADGVKNVLNLALVGSGAHFFDARTADSLTHV